MSNESLADRLRRELEHKKHFHAPVTLGYAMTEEILIALAERDALDELFDEYALPLPPPPTGEQTNG